MCTARTFARPFEILWNAMATPHGRRNAIYRWRRWKLRTFTTFGQGKPATYRLRDGRRFVAHPGDSLSIAIADNRSYEWVETRVARRVLRPGDVAVDIGANIGYYTGLFSDCVGRRGEVFAFEPGQATFAKLRLTIELLNLANVDAQHAALAEHGGVRRFIVSTSGNDAQQSLVDWEGFPGSKSAIEVEAITLDAFLAQALPARRKVALVKCDVEGAEIKVLNGAAGLLQSADPPVLIVEANRKALAAHGADVGALLGLLDSYRLYFKPLDQHRRTLQAVTGAAELPNLANIIAFPQRGAFADRIAAVAAARLLPDH